MSRHLSLDNHTVLFTNDSDDPEPNDDYVSFPTLPDPDTSTSRPLSTIISKTLRKVTNNASNLVHTYTTPRHLELHPDLIDTLSIYSAIKSPVQVSDRRDSDIASLAAADAPTPPQHLLSESTAPISGPTRTSTVGSTAHTVYSVPQLQTQSQIGPLLAATDALLETQTSALGIKLPTSSLTTSLHSMTPSLTHPDASAGKRGTESSGFVGPNADRAPKVTSDNRFLRVSTMRPSKLPGIMVSKNEVTVVNTDVATTPAESLLLADLGKEDGTKVRLQQSSNTDGPDSRATLQKRISSIFNNLPNDIEVSDDSASDLETINNDSVISLPILHSPSSRTRIVPMKSLSRNQVSPAKVNSDPAYFSRTSDSPTVSSFQSLKGTNHLTRKISANFPSAILDGAKNIINTNLAGVASSTTSIVESITEKKKKKKRVKLRRELSDNPLKNGGIPKKYWMNDAFVSECLHCFKPFTAFRRKHHCRFCGQIFCSDCTMFISYNQYKQQRKAEEGTTVKDIRSFSDKLRVCKPCYGDVIVYLSDDSGSSSESEAEETPARRFDNNSDQEDSIAPDHPLSRFRSHSLSSRRNSFIHDSPAQSGNKVFLNRTPRESPSLASAALPADATQRSPEGISYKHAPQMAIPTTRAGESVEIQVPAQKPLFGSLPLKSNLAILAMKNSASTNLHPGAGNGNDVVVSKPGSWFNHYPYHNSLGTSEIEPASSLENLGLFYKAVVNSRYGRLTSNSEGIGLISRSLSANDQDFDVESENEDEQAMSLYTSLNHGATNQNALSPRNHNGKTLSASGVPTLHEFPTMVIDDKYIPANFTERNDLKRFEFKPMDSFYNASVNENKLRSDYRSNERAKASLRRIRHRRTNKLGRKSALEAPRLHQIDTSGTAIGSSPLSTPTSPTPKNQLSYFQPSSVPKRNSSTLGVVTVKRTPLQSTIATPNTKIAEGKDINHVLQYSLDEIDKDSNQYVNDYYLSDYFESFQASQAKVYDDHVKNLITQCLEDCDIKNPKEKERWLKVLHLTLLNINQIKIGDTLDIKQYVKIKKIFGGAISETCIIDGLFITKNIDSKKMKSKIENPKIALLMFPIEYLKQKEKFISLRIVNSQQAVYINNLVSRLISLEPDLIVVGDTVCGLAEQLLEDANITVISNVKPQVLERISRYTRGDIFQSVNDLFFKKGTLGTCELFEVKRYLYKDLVKTYSFFTGTDITSGFTICLRGGDEELLGSTKYAAESLAPGVFNARFEISFFKNLSLIIEEPALDLASHAFDDLHAIMQSDNDTLDDAQLSCLQTITHYGVYDYVSLFCKRILSDSPAVKFSLPRALINVISALKAYMNFCELNKMIQQLEPSDDIQSGWLEQLNFDFNLERFGGKEEVMDILKFVGTNKANILLNEFNFRMRVWSNIMKYPIYQLYPIFHKSIHCLHSTVSLKHATPCYGPICVVIDYYTENDKCLGMFLDQMLQDSGKVCDECGELMLDHYKTYAHDNAKLDMIVERVDNIGGNEEFKGTNQRIMWSYCPECNISTPITVMTNEMYYLSLGKFLELNFWARDVSYFKDCPHDYFKTHVKYFGVNNLVIRMEYGSIDTYEVVVPRKKLEFTVETDIKLKLESFEQIQDSSKSFFQSISQRLERVKVDTFDKAEAGRQKIEELKDKLQTQEDYIHSRTLAIYKSTPPTNYLSLNVIQRDLQELGVFWDTEFNQFETDYLPTENEITKITQFHLRNFLIDKFDSEMKETGSEDLQRASVEGEPKSSQLSSEQSEKSSTGSPNIPKPLSDIKDFAGLGSRIRVPLSIIEDKILQFKQSLENDQKLVMKNSSKSRSNSITGDIGSDPNPQQMPNRVQDLTNYFNQMTLEFQRQREEVLEKKSNNYKAAPIVNSKPIVEMYDNIEDVVDVNSLHIKRDDSPITVVASPLRSSPTFDSGDTKQSTQNMSQQANLERRQDSMQYEQRRNVTSGGERLLPKISKEAVPKQKLEIPQPERNSLLKTLTNFWADRSATLWEPLKYPLDFTEHTFADSDVIVREDEPSSLVAFCLSTNDYKQKINDMATNHESNNDNLENNEQYINKLSNFTKIERKFKKFSKTDNETSETEETMTKTKSTHLKYQFSDGKSELSCKIFYSEQFEAFRKACGVDDSFVQSLSRCVKWNSEGGKSGSHFLKTLDNKYILKELSKSELESFVSIAPFYFKYISQSTFNTLTTAIAKIFGFYQVEIKNSINGKTFKMDFLIMENLFYNRTTTRIFDLKGSMRNRHVKQTGKENEVLLDENMIEYIYESPLFVREHSKKLLRGSLFNDTSFLSAMDVMDYSLVVGVDDTSRKLYVGIIDWLRTFTWDKKVENWMKGNGLVSKKNKDPTIVTPKQYRTRFREAMDRYVLEVPDIWYEGN